MQSRRGFLQSLGVAATGSGLIAQGSIGQEIKAGYVPTLKPPFRLSVGWYRGTVQRFQARLRELKLDGAIVRTS